MSPSCETSRRISAAMMPGPCDRAQADNACGRVAGVQAVFALRHDGTGWRRPDSLRNETRIRLDGGEVKSDVRHLGCPPPKDDDRRIVG